MVALERDLGLGEVVLGELQLVLEVDPAAGGVGDGEPRVELGQGHHDPVGDRGGLGWVPVLVADLDHALLACAHLQVVLEVLAGVDLEFGVVVGLQGEALDEGVLNRAGLDEGHVDVAGVLAERHDAPADTAQERRGRGLVDHGRHDACAGGVPGRDQQDDRDRDEADQQRQAEDEAPALGEDDQEVDEAQLVLLKKFCVCVCQVLSPSSASTWSGRGYRPRLGRTGRRSG